MVVIVAFALCHDGPKNPSVFVGECHHSFLPAAAFSQLLCPLRYGVIVVLAGQHRRLSALYQQVAQIVAATLGYAAQAGLATAGILSRRQSQPGAKLCPVLELFEIPHRDDNSRRRDGANALEFGCPLNLFIIFLMSGNALVAPLNMGFDFAPVLLCTLQYQSSHACDVVAGIFQYIVQMLA